MFFKDRVFILTSFAGMLVCSLTLILLKSSQTSKEARSPYLFGSRALASEGAIEDAVRTFTDQFLEETLSILLNDSLVKEEKVEQLAELIELNADLKHLSRESLNHQDYRSLSKEDKLEYMKNFQTYLEKVKILELLNLNTPTSYYPVEQVEFENSQAYASYKIPMGKAEYDVSIEVHVSEEQMKIANLYLAKYSLTDAIQEEFDRKIQEVGLENFLKNHLGN